ncbi:MAG: hypothetical protein AAGI25_03850 [Bacteroidota bacterium]
MGRVYLLVIIGFFIVNGSYGIGDRWFFIESYSIQIKDVFLPVKPNC